MFKGLSHAHGPRTGQSTVLGARCRFPLPVPLGRGLPSDSAAAAADGTNRAAPAPAPRAAPGITRRRRPPAPAPSPCRAHRRAGPGRSGAGGASPPAGYITVTDGPWARPRAQANSFPLRTSGVGQAVPSPAPGLCRPLTPEFQLPARHLQRRRRAPPGPAQHPPTPPSARRGRSGTAPARGRCLTLGVCGVSKRRNLRKVL